MRLAKIAVVAAMVVGLAYGQTSPVRITGSSITEGATCGVFGAWMDGSSGANKGKIFTCEGTPTKWILVNDGGNTEIRYANVYATGGTGTSEDPWTSASGTAGLQEAINSCPSAGCRVHMPAGVYSFSNSAFLKSFVTVSGDGAGKTILFRANGTVTNSSSKLNSSILQAGPSQGTYYSKTSPGYNIEIRDLTVDGNYTNQTVTIDTGAHGINFPCAVGGTPSGSIDGVSLHDLEVKNTLQSGIYVYNSRNILIKNNYIHTVGKIDGIMSKNGISISGNFCNTEPTWCKDVTISNNRIHDAGHDTGGIGEGIAVSSLSNVVITGNDVSMVDVGIEGTPADTGTYYNWSISGNTFHNARTTTPGASVAIGITHQYGGLYKGISITGNQVYDWSLNCMYLARIDSLTVSGNSCLRTNIVYNGSIYVYGINVIAAHGFSITGNTIIFDDSVQSNVTGLLVQGLVWMPEKPDETVTDGVISGNTIKGATNNGIVISGNASHIETSQNLLSEIGARAIWIHDYGTNHDNYVHGNEVTDAGMTPYYDGSGQKNTWEYVVNDCTQLQQTLAYLPDSGGDIYVRDGDSTCSNIVGITKSHTHIFFGRGTITFDATKSYGLCVLTGTGSLHDVWIIGKGPGPRGASSLSGTNRGTRFVYQGPGDAIRLGDFTNSYPNTNQLEGAILQDFGVLFSGTPSTTDAIHGITVRRSLFKNLNLQNNMYGLRLETVSDFNTIEGCTIANNRTTGIYMNRECNGTVIRDTDVLNAIQGTGYTNDGIIVDFASENTLIEGSRFHNFDGTGKAAVSIRRSSAATIEGNYFEGNTNAIYLLAGTDFPTSDVNVLSNWISQIRQYGVQINHGGTPVVAGVKISANRFHNPDEVTPPYDTATGVYISTAGRAIKMENNTFWNIKTKVTNVSRLENLSETGDRVLTTSYTVDPTDAENNDGMWLAGEVYSNVLNIGRADTTTTSTNISPNIRFRDNQASPQSFIMRKDYDNFMIGDNSGVGQWNISQTGNMKFGGNDNADIYIEFDQSSTLATDPRIEYDSATGQTQFYTPTNETDNKGFTFGRKHNPNANFFVQIAKEFDMAGQADGSQIQLNRLYLSGNGSGKNFNGVFADVFNTAGCTTCGWNQTIAMGGYARNRASDTGSGGAFLYGGEFVGEIGGRSSVTTVEGARLSCQISQDGSGQTADGDITYCIGTNTGAAMYSDTSSGATITNGYGMRATISQAGPSGTAITTGMAVDTECLLSGAGNMTDCYGVHVRNGNDTGGGAITNLYGIVIEDHTAGSTINREFWNKGDSLLDGTTTIGSSGNFTAGSATSSIPWKVTTDCSGVATEGAGCWESGTDTLWVGDGSAPPQKINGQARYFSHRMVNPGGTENQGVMWFENAATIVETMCVVNGGTTPTVTFEIHSSTARNTDGTTNDTIVCDTTGAGESDTSPSTAAIAAGRWVFIKTTNSTGSPTELLITVRYTEP